jgi:hypothetical protein
MADTFSCSHFRSSYKEPDSLFASVTTWYAYGTFRMPDEQKPPIVHQHYASYKRSQVARLRSFEAFLRRKTPNRASHRKNSADDVSIMSAGCRLLCELAKKLNYATSVRPLLGTPISLFPRCISYCWIYFTPTERLGKRGWKSSSTDKQS